MRLKLADDLTFPADAVTETFAVLAVRGAGKSNAAAVMAEEMHRTGLPFVVVDPVGSWWGLRSSQDGKGPGLPLPIFGGKHGDVPLERTGGALVADLVVDQRLSCVLDLSGFESESAKKQFLLDFAQRLYRRNTEPLHLFLEEADDYIPQRPMGNDEKYLLRAWENIVRRGRARGLGMTMITQRSAAINKNVLTQCQTLIALRTTGPQDRAAVEEWLKYHDQSREILASLPSLANGEAWVWSPQFLGQTVRVRFHRRRTFDSASTPKLAKGTKAPATLADVDLGAIQTAMQATIERAKQDDPAELRRRIATLEREARKPVTVGPATERVEVKVPVIDPPTLHTLEEACDHALGESEALRQQFDRAAQAGMDLRVVVGEVRQILETARAIAAQRPTTPPRAVAPAPSPRRQPAAVAHEGGLPPSERRILTALAQHPEGRTLRQVAILTGYKRSGGRFQNLMGALRTAGYLERQGDLARITDAGLVALGEWDPLPTGADLLDYWLRQLPASEAKVLQAVATHGRLGKDELAAATDYDAAGGRFQNILGKLRTLELVTRGWPAALSEELQG